METSFFTHDEHSSSFYSNNQELEDSEGSLFGGIINSELDYSGSQFDQLPALWDPAEDDQHAISQEGDSLVSPVDCKEDFQQMLTDWHEHLTSLQIQEPIKLLPNARTDSIAIPTDIPDLFSNTVGNNLISTPFIDDLFPIEFKTEVVDVTTNDDISETDSLLDKGNCEIVKTSTIPKCYEAEEVDVEETVGEQMPVLEAGDLTSLLEQFEASEVVNNNTEKKPITSQSLMVCPTSSFPSNQSIRESLPQEVIDRIKASGRKKVFSVIPAMLPKRSGKAGTRMQDAGFALSRNKLLKLVTIGSSGESVQLDHDYCTSVDSGSVQNYYQSEGSEYSSQSSTPELPYRFFDYAIQQKNIESKLFNESWIEKNSKKDSGLESGDVSDASEEIQIVNEINTKGKVVLKNISGIKSVNLVTESGFVIGSASVKDRKEMTMVSVLKKYNCNNQSVQSSVSVSTSTNTSTDNDDSVALKPAKKRKLNLEEYRVRREERERKRSLENSRSNSPFSMDCSPDSTEDSCATTQKPLMHSVEVQTQLSDFVDTELTKTKNEIKSKSDKGQQHERRSDSRRRSYRARHPSSSSSSSSNESGRHRSHRKRKNSRSDRQYRTTSRLWSRSRSRSSTRSSQTNRSSSSSPSRSRSRDSHHSSKRHSRLPRRSYNKPQNRRDVRRWQSSRSPIRPTRNQEWDGAEKLRQVEERRVIYVGRIEEGTTKAHLRARFEVFGPIVDISVHFRERGDNYGFVTFAYKVDAYEAVEHGNDDPSLPHYDLCFGGRRAFCKQRYADLDGVSTNSNQYNPYQLQRSNDSFDLLLREAQAKLRKRSSV